MNRSLGSVFRAAALASLAVFSIHGASAAETKSVVLAGGCFWCVESDFDSVEGVVGTTSGYTGGTTDDPTYKEVTSQRTGHFEAVKIDYDPEIVTYRELVDLFWRSVDPTDAGGQFCDRGPSYRTAVFVMNEDEKSEANASKLAAANDLGMEIVTPILDFDRFFQAEDRHQDYYLGQNRVLTRFGVVKQADAYKRYREACGRDDRVQALWGDQAIFAH